MVKRLRTSMVIILNVVLSASMVCAQNIPRKELVRRAWEASGTGDLNNVIEVTDYCVATLQSEADALHATLQDFPPRDNAEEYKALNDMATCMFIKAEALMHHGKSQEAIALFEKIINEYPWSQSWDPRGWYWSVAEKSQASIDMLTGKVQEKEPEKVVKTEPKTLPSLHTKGTENVIDYTHYGKFVGEGSEHYRYDADDPKGLSDAVGEGIYPNTGAVLKNPAYARLKKEGRLEGSHWDYVHSQDLQAAFFKWATASEPWGVKLFYLGLIFEKAEMYYEALKCYRAIIVHFPKTTGRTYWNTPWYPGQAAIAKVKHLIRVHPELDLKFEGAKIQVIKGYDNNVANDSVITSPGVLRKKTFLDRLKQKIGWDKRRVRLGRPVRQLGKGTVQLVQYKNGHWQLLVEDEPYIIKGITYTPTKVGQSPDKGTLADWMIEDTNHNGLPDGPYDSWVDKNRNNKQDFDELVVGDFKLLQELGANTIRIYQQPFKPNKEVLRKMYDEYGIRVILGDFLGKYALGSGASWYEGTDYENSEHQKNMLNSVKEMVMEFKDEPYVLMWLLGNENNYGVACNADTKPEAYFKFVNEVAQWIKSVDPNHPVAMCNGDTLYLDIFAQYAPDVDAFAANAYRGDYGFGAYWEQVFDATGKAGFITEYGCPAYASHLDREGAEEAQANYHKGNWMDIMSNAAGARDGVGNALGGIVFQWMDEWWKNYEPAFHDKTAGALGPFPDGYMYEEWFGIIGQGDGTNSPFLRQLRKSYFLYKEMWQ